MNLDFRPPADGDWPAFTGLMQEAFIERWPAGTAERMRLLSDLARPLAGYDADRVEATGGVYRHVLQVPGGSMPCAGITWITVSTRHRRTGVLTEMMRRLQETGLAAGEPVAALYAAEGAIYGRFGFGVAAKSISIKVAARELAALPAPPGRVVEVSSEEAAARFPAVFDAVTAGRPGVVARHPQWWARVMDIGAREDPTWASPRYLVYIDDAGRDQGIATARLRGSERGLLFHGTCRLSELYPVDHRAAAALWRYAGAFDLVESVVAGMRPSDDPLPLMLPDLRQVRVRPDEELWVHLTDPIAALEGRRYGVNGSIRFSLRDPLWPRAEGTYELRTSDGSATCTRVDGDADLDLDGAALGAVYLGATSPLQLAAAGRIIEHRENAAANAHRLFHWAPPAWGADMW